MPIICNRLYCSDGIGWVKWEYRYISIPTYLCTDWETKFQLIKYWLSLLSCLSIDGFSSHFRTSVSVLRFLYFSISTSLPVIASHAVSGTLVCLPSRLSGVRKWNELAGFKLRLEHVVMLYCLLFPWQPQATHQKLDRNQNKCLFS